VQKLRRTVLAILAPLLILVALSASACWGGGNGGAGSDTTSSTVADGSKSGDISAVLGEEIRVGAAIITVRALQATFQPAMPTQRLSENTPSAPGAGQSFYQAYVRVMNTGVTPLRVDPNDFACHIGDTVVSIEPTRSGPEARSLLKGTSLDLLLTFKGPVGYQAELMYKPSWYNGVISVGPEVEEESTTTTE
jgi:hypothetical protein